MVRDPPAAAGAVHRIADDRVADVRQVDADLVGTASVQLEPEQVHEIETPR